MNLRLERLRVAQLIKKFIVLLEPKKLLPLLQERATGP
jgi:hypothetical protein